MSSPPTAAGSGGAGPSASAAAGGGGTRAGAEASAVAGMGGMEPAGGMQCPGEICEGLPPLPEVAASMEITLASCCTPEGQCGTSRNEMPCQLIPDSDPQCPPLEVMGFKIASCCTADGRCGLNARMMCTSLEDVKASFGAFVTVPAPKACTSMMVPQTPPAAGAPVI